MEGVDDELAAIVRARIGTTVCGGKYTIESVLGIGGMAAVYAGTHRNGRPIAMKLLHPEYSRRADIRKRFLREGQAANAVQHRGVVAVIDDDVAEDGAAFVVMERLEGKTLEQLWEGLERRLPIKAVLAIGRELCEVLAVAHRAGIIHRDLKPENLFLTNDGELKVLDFGLAQVRDAARPTETQTGMVFGTPAFMPPEQASGQTSKIDARTDLWAVGATMFTLLSGQLVHHGESAQHFVMLAATQPARSLAVVLPQAHPALVALVDRALARNKDERWQSAESMREAIVSLSERLLREPEPPLMTPLALAEAHRAKAKPKPKPKPASGLEDSTLDQVKVSPIPDLLEQSLDETKPDAQMLEDETLTGATRRKEVAPLEDSLESSEDQTRVGVPDFAVSSDGTDTEPNEQRKSSKKLPHLGDESSDPSTEGIASQDLATQVRAVRESPPEPPTAHMKKRASWSDLRQAVEQVKRVDPDADADDARTQLRKPFKSEAEPPLDRTALLRSAGAFASGHAHPAPRPSAPSLPSVAIPQTRASHLPPIPIRQTGRKTVSTRGRPAATIPYLPVVLAAILLGLSPLAYFVARSCGSASPGADTHSAAAPPAEAALPARDHSPIAPGAAAPPSRIQPERAPAPSSSLVPSNPSAAPEAPLVPINSSNVLPANPYPESSTQPRRDNPREAGKSVPPNPYSAQSLQPRAVTPPPSRPRAECSPPYTIDDAGGRHFKIDCFDR